MRLNNTRRTHPIFVFLISFSALSMLSPKNPAWSQPHTGYTMSEIIDILDGEDKEAQLTLRDELKETRSNLLNNLYGLITAEELSNNPDMSRQKALAIYLLGEYRASNYRAIKFLIDNITYEYTELPIGTKYPSLDALIKIGGPATPRIFARLDEEVVDRLEFVLLSSYICSAYGLEIGRSVLVDKLRLARARTVGYERMEQRRREGRLLVGGKVLDGDGAHATNLARIKESNVENLLQVYDSTHYEGADLDVCDNFKSRNEDTRRNKINVDYTERLGFRDRPLLLSVDRIHLNFEAAEKIRMSRQLLIKELTRTWKRHGLHEGGRSKLIVDLLIDYRAEQGETIASLVTCAEHQLMSGQVGIGSPCTYALTRVGEPAIWAVLSRFSESLTDRRLKSLAVIINRIVHAEGGNRDDALWRIIPELEKERSEDRKRRLQKLVDIVEDIAIAL